MEKRIGLNTYIFFDQTSISSELELDSESSIYELIKFSVIEKIKWSSFFYLDSALNSNHLFLCKIDVIPSDLERKKIVFYIKSINLDFYSFFDEVQFLLLMNKIKICDFTHILMTYPKDIVDSSFFKEETINSQALLSVFDTKNQLKDRGDNFIVSRISEILREKMQNSIAKYYNVAIKMKKVKSVNIDDYTRCIQYINQYNAYIDYIQSLFIPY